MENPIPLLSMFQNQPKQVLHEYKKDLNLTLKSCDMASHK